MNAAEPSLEPPWTLLQGSTEFFPALVQAIDAAEQEIWFETYLFNIAAQGQTVAAALERAAWRGVAVRVVLDGAGSRDMAPEWLERWRQAGVHWRIFDPVGPAGLWFPSRWRRLHRKLCVIDARQAFCGGINILDDGYDPHVQRALDHPRLDYAVALTQAPLVADILAVMSQLWWRLEISRNLRARRIGAALEAWRGGDPGAESPARGDMRLVLRDNVRHRYGIQRSYLKAIGRAKKDILIANAFFFPASKLRRALQTAAARGVRVRLLLPGYYEFAVPYRASRVVYRQLLQAGIEIYEYHASYLHAKVAVVDDRWATVGSSNLDPLSLLLAREANLVAEDVAFATQLRNRLEQQMKTGAHWVRPRLERLGWLERLLDIAAYALMRALIVLAARRY
ncbi:MAG: cardiolipin synthase ClsB [Pseudomonadota bacterium]|jgi:cardiolipin synthase A/B